MATATILPNARFTAFDTNGNPLSGGKVNTYLPGGTTPQVTWQDAAETIPNTNPVILDASGSALIYGASAFQMTVTDSLGNAVPAYSGISTALAYVSPAMLPVVGALTLTAAETALGITPAMQPVVGAATLALARTAFGVPSTLLAPAIFATIAALRLNAVTQPAVVAVSGYAVGADGGEGLFWASGDVTSADNGGTIIIDAQGTRWYRETSGAAFNVRWFGANPSLTDNAASFNACLAALGTNGGRIHIPGGLYTLLSQIVYTMPSATAVVTLEGPGAEVARLSWPNAGGGMRINILGPYNSVHIRGLTFISGQINSDTGLQLVQTAASATPSYGAMSDLTDLVFRGSGGFYGATYWNTAIAVTCVSNINFNQVNVAGLGGVAFSTFGNGITLQGSVSAPGVVYNFNNCSFNLLNKGLTIGGYAQGITVTGLNATGCSYGIFTLTGLSFLDQCTVVASQFNCSVCAIDLATAPQDTMISGNLFLLDVANAIGVQLIGTQGYSITGNMFHGNGLASLDGVVIAAAGGLGGTISGNVFTNITTGIWLQAGSFGANVQSNLYNAISGSNVINAGGGNIIGGGSI